jgi:hypothetical protein
MPRRKTMVLCHQRSCCRIVSRKAGVRPRIKSEGMLFRKMLKARRLTDLSAYSHSRCAAARTSDGVAP